MIENCFYLEKKYICLYSEKYLRICSFLPCSASSYICYNSVNYGELIIIVYKTYSNFNQEVYTQFYSLKKIDITLVNKII